MAPRLNPPRDVGFPERRRRSLNRRQSTAEDARSLTVSSPYARAPRRSAAAAAGSSPATCRATASTSWRAYRSSERTKACRQPPELDQQRHRVGEGGVEPPQPKRGLYRALGSPVPSSPGAEEVGVEPTRVLAHPDGFRDRGRRHLSAGSSWTYAESARIEHARARTRRRLSKPLPSHSANSPKLPDEDSNLELPDSESGVLPVAPSGKGAGGKRRPPWRGLPAGGWSTCVVDGYVACPGMLCG